MATIPGVGGMGLRALMSFRESFVYTIANISYEPFERATEALNSMHGLSIWLKHMKVDDEGAVKLGSLAGELNTGYYTRDEFIEALEDVFTAEDTKALLDIIDTKDA